MHNRRKFLQLGFKTAIIISAGNVLQSFTTSAFKFPSKDEVSLRFAVVSDGHYGQPDTDYETMHNQMVEWINAEEKTRGVEFCFVNGDLFHDNNAMMPLVKKLWDKFEMPYYVSHGNHDKINEDAWQQTFNTRWHYAFEKQDVAFIVLNSADETGKYICPDLGFTKQQLDKYADRKHLFVFQHITPFGWTKAGLPCPELTALFSKQQNLKAVFHGHDHDEDGMKESDGKYYFFDSHVAGNWGTAYHGCRIIEILKNGSILTYQINPFKEGRVNSNNI